MSLGPILHRRTISDRQFAGDLNSLFARHRIAPGSAFAVANFESRFALSEAFRSQLFTLCTAISHMSEADLTSQQLLALIACALNSTEPSDGRAELSEWVRVEFEDGYDAWNARDLSNADEWQTLQQPTDSDPVAFPQAANTDIERASLVVEIPGTDMFQGHHDIVPHTSALEPQAVAGVDLEHLTLDELTRLLEKMEHRIRRLKPHIRPMGEVTPQQEETSIAAVEQVARAVRSPVQIDDTAFLARHAYLTPGRRVISIDRALPIAPSSPIDWGGLMRAAACPAVTNAAGSPPPNEAAEMTMAGQLCTEAPRRLRNEGLTSVDQRATYSRVSVRTAIGAIAASVMFVIIAGGLAGIVFYPSAVATYFNQPSGLNPRMQKGAEATQVAANPGSLANAPATTTRRLANASSHRSLSRIQWNAQASRSEPAADDAPPQPQ